MKRPHHLGKVVPLVVTILVEALDNYVDSVPFDEHNDALLFDLGSYVTKGRQRYDIIVILRLEKLVTAFLNAGKVVRFLLTQLRSAFILLFSRTK